MRLTSTRLTFTAGLVLLLGGLAFVAAAPGGAQPAPPGTEPPTPTPTNVPGSVIAWDDIADATFPDPAAPEEAIDLAGGSYTEAGFSPDGPSRSIQLADLRAYGDLDGDGDLDAAGVLSDATGDEPTVRHLVAILDVEGEAQPAASVTLGENVIVRGLEITEGTIRVTTGVLKEDEHYPSSELVRTYTLDGEMLELVDEEEIPFEPPQSDGEATPATLGVSPTARSRTIEGSVEFDTIDTYTVHAREGETLTVTLESELPQLALSIVGVEDGEVLLSVLEEATSFSGTVPSTQDYEVRVVPLGGGTTKYSLTAQRSYPGIRKAPGFTVVVPEVMRDGPLPTPTPTPNPTATPTVTPPPPTPTPNSNNSTIYLTFDDGPSPPYTGQILDVLSAYGASATFFVVGSQIEAHPSVVTNEVDRGHTVGNHTYNHVSLDQVSRDTFFAEVQSTQNLINQHADGGATTCLRPPYGAINPQARAYANELGYTIVLWDIDTRDWSLPGQGAIISSVLNGAADGAVVLMHDGGGDRSQTVAALDTVLSELSNRGYRFATLRC